MALIDPTVDPRTDLYMMNQARGRAATVAVPFKHAFLVGNNVRITALAARDLPENTELTWDYNPSPGKRFPWEPMSPRRPATVATPHPPGAPRPKKRKRAATGWGADDARKRAKARKEAAARRAGTQGAGAADGGGRDQQR